MSKLKNSIIFFIIVIIFLYIATISLNKKTIDNYQNLNEREKNINNLRGLLWASYITNTVVSVYLLIRLSSKSMFIITILILLLNTALIIHEEYMLTASYNKKNIDEEGFKSMYVETTVITVINILMLLSLIYHTKELVPSEKESKIYKPKYETIQYEYTEENGVVYPSMLNSNKPILKPTSKISYKNVFQKKPIKVYIDPSLIPSRKPIKSLRPKKNKNLFEKTEYSYVNPLLL